MKKILVCLFVAATAAFGQYKMEPAAAPPVFASELQEQGAKVLDAPASPGPRCGSANRRRRAPKPLKTPSAFPAIPHGALIGVIRFAGQGADRRGQVLKPGVYTMRYSRYPVDGAHQGVAPQRDFLLLVPAAEDKDPASTPEYDPLVQMSRKRPEPPTRLCSKS